MRLDELFNSGESITSGLQQAAIDILTPLLANKVPFVTIQSVIDNLRSSRPGIVIDRALIMKILDPNKIQSISKIEGDRIYLQSPDENSVNSAEDEEQDQIDKVKKDAMAKAQSDVKDNAKPAAPAPKMTPVPPKPPM
jgi:hypothetical protein